MSARTRVAVIGLGRMGGPIADRLVTAGHDVVVHDVDAAAMAPRVAAGARAAATPALAADGAALVGVVVFDDAQAVEVVAGPEGVLETLAPGAIVCIHTTARLETVRDLAARGAAKGVVVLDAGVSGGEAGAAAGTLYTMVGGPADAVERARPVLLAFSGEVVHAGPLGAGMALKLARNATFYVAMVAVHEAMELASRSGIELDVLRRTIEETDVFALSFSPFSLGGPEPLTDDGPAAMRGLLEHTRDLAEKDLDQALALAAGIGATVPVIEATRRDFHRAVRL